MSLVYRNKFECFQVLFLFALASMCSYLTIKKKNFLSSFFFRRHFFDFFIFAQFWSELSLFCTEKCFFPFTTVSESVVLFQKCLCLNAATHFFQNLLWSVYLLFTFCTVFKYCVLCCKKLEKDLNLWTKQFLLFDWNQTDETTEHRRNSEKKKKEKRDRLLWTSSWRGKPAKLRV